MVTEKQIDKFLKENPVKEFEQVIGYAELRALSKISLERPLTDAEFKRMMDLRLNNIPKIKSGRSLNPIREEHTIKR